MQKNHYHLKFLRQLRNSIELRESNTKLNYIVLICAWISLIFLFFSEKPLIGTCFLLSFFLLHGILTSMNNVHTEQIEESLTRIPENEADSSKRKALAYQIVEDLKNNLETPYQADPFLAVDNLEENICPLSLVDNSIEDFERSDSKTLRLKLAVSMVELPLAAESLRVDPTQKKSIFGKLPYNQWIKFYSAEPWKETKRHEITELLKAPTQAINNKIKHIDKNTYTERPRTTQADAFNKVIINPVKYLEF